MIGFLTNNWGTILIGAVVAGIIALIVVKMISDKKRGKTSCGCGCDSCGAKDACHKK